MDLPTSQRETDVGTDEPSSRRQLARRSALREYLEAFAFALLVALAIRSFAVQAYKIPSSSMLPTLQIGDHLLINKLRYGIREPFFDGWLWLYSQPKPGDVAVFIYPQDRSKDFIKRVIAVGGETVEIRDKTVLVNGRPRDTPYAYFADGRDSIQPIGPRDNFGPVTVPTGHLFMLGDNRDRSYDSRFWGFVDVDDVKGKAVVIYWSWDGRDRWVRWERLGDLIR
jgi:signal peptidase I